MKNFSRLAVIFIALFYVNCSAPKGAGNSSVNREGVVIKSGVVLKEKIPRRTINTKNISAHEVITFAETLRGTPYRYASAVKEKGFDCSGFIFYVFNRFKISVPRTSKEFTNAGLEVNNIESRRGDIILFTGSDVKSGVVGHMGFITKNQKGVLQFIHASSGKGGGVMISTMNSYFMPRFVKIIRVFKEA